MASPTKRFKLIPAVYLILRRRDQILLSRRANTGYQDGTYNLVAGHIEGNELATRAAVREAKEEAGIDVDPSRLQFVHVAHRLNREQSGQERLELFYELRSWRGHITNNEPDKCDDLSWFAMNALPPTISPFIQCVLTHIANGSAYSEYEFDPV